MAIYILAQTLAKYLKKFVIIWNSIHAKLYLWGWKKNIILKVTLEPLLKQLNFTFNHTPIGSTEERLISSLHLLRFEERL